MASSEPRVVIVGPVTRDLFPDRSVPGGAVSYAARTAAAMGERLGILTCGAPDADIAALVGHDIMFVASDATLTFEHSSSSAGRQLRVAQRQMRALSAADLPTGWDRAQILILAPLLPGDIDLGSFGTVPWPDVALLGQGLQRHITPSSSVLSVLSPSSDLSSAIAPSASLFLSYEETCGWSHEDLHDVTSHVRRFAITRGDEGADIRSGPGAPLHVDACPATPVDTTGAGDVFATAFMLALDDGDEAAARLACAFAAASVELEGPAPLPARDDVARRLRPVTEASQP